MGEIRLHVTPILILDGEDVSRYFISSHSEQTSNASKDPNKYDLVLANIGGRFLGSFAPKSYEDQTEEGLGDFELAPKHKVNLSVRVHGEDCDAGVDRTVVIFNGEIQKAEADELFLKIEGSCLQGGMTSSVKFTHIWNKTTPITQIVNDLLDDFGITDAVRYIYPAVPFPPDENPKLEEVMSFDTSMYEVSCWAESIYFFDENGDFWFIPATSRMGFSNLDGNILRGSNATNMVGYCNHVIVYPGTLDDGEPINTRQTHLTNPAEAFAPAVEIESYGLLTAPPVTVHNASPQRAQEIADKLLEWYRQYKDVPTVKVVGKAPGLMSKVSYRPWNGSMPPISCLAGEEVDISPVMGIVSRRIVDISAEGGFVSTLDVTTNFLGVNKPEADQDMYNFYSQYQTQIDRDEGLSPDGGILEVD